jgi:hypothetical protein
MESFMFITWKTEYTMASLVFITWNT